MLAEGLESCCFCQQPIQLKNVVDEKRYGLASLLYIHPAFPTSATPLFDLIFLKHFIPVRTLKLR